MRFRTVVIAAAILVVAAAGGLAVFQIAEDARGEAGQVATDRSDSRAVTSGIEQKLVADSDHEPTRYADSVTVVYNGTELQPSGNYTYNASAGTLTFQIDRSSPDEADIDYTYFIPKNQASDEQLQVLTEGTSRILMVGTGLSFVVLLLFIGGFAAKRIGLGRRSARGR